MLKNKIPKSLINIAVLVGLLIFLHFIRLLGPVESLVVRMLNPVTRSFYAAGSNIRNTYEDIVNEVDLKKINEELEQKNKILTEENLRLRVVEDENRSLREYLNFLAKHEYKYLMANIISRGDLTSHNQVIMIDKGSNDGVKEGLAIVSGKGMVVGKIFDVRGNSSSAYLITNPLCRLAAMTSINTKTNGIVQGDLGLTIKMNFIPQTEKISKGDSVISSGLEENIPRGLVIGEVSEVSAQSNELWQSATIVPFMNIDEMMIVSVLIP